MSDREGWLGLTLREGPPGLWGAGHSQSWVLGPKGSRMTPPNQWTWVWANSGRKWRTWKSGLLQSMMSQRVEHDLVTEQQHHVYLWIIFIPPAGSKGIKGYKVVWLKDLLVRFYGLHTLKFQIVRGRYLGRQCIQTSKETAVASSHKKGL